jgi:tRNA 2-thiouridine synthesizing protein A
MRTLMAGMIGTLADFCDPRHNRRVMTEKLIDLRGLKCPLPVLRTRKALTACAPGDILAVQCTDPLAVIDIPNLLRKSGDVIEETRREDGVTTFRIRKR